MKRFFPILVVLLLASYIFFSVCFLMNYKSDIICDGIEVIVKDSLDKHFVNEKDIVSILKSAELNPVNSPMTDINTDKIETELEKNQMISNVEAYKTPSGKIKLEIRQKIPILRILGVNDNFYIDNLGSIMPISPRYVAHVPIATGHIKKEFAQAELYNFALFLQEDNFWNSQIEQIHVSQNEEIELIPRIGNHRILLGSFDHYKEKLANLQLFYKQIVPKMGWEKYREINLKYKDQIVCTKK